MCIDYYHPYNKQHFYFQGDKVLPLTIFNMCFWKSFIVPSKWSIIFVITRFMFILFYLQVFAKLHINRWLIFKSFASCSKCISVQMDTRLQCQYCTFTIWTRDLWQETLCSVLYLNKENAWLIATHN